MKSLIIIVIPVIIVAATVVVPEHMHKKHVLKLCLLLQLLHL
jgi:hypothetical protein